MGAAEVLSIMSGKVSAIGRPPAANCTPRVLGVTGILGIDEWKSHCNVQHAAGKLHLPRFTINVRPRLMCGPKPRSLLKQLGKNPMQSIRIEFPNITYISNALR
jgi:hypothetical protein